MKRIIAMLLVVRLIMGLMTACDAKISVHAETAVSEKKAAKDLISLVSADLNNLLRFPDGTNMTDGNVKFEQIKDKFAEVELSGVYY